jgi:hypothetical protein
MTKPITLPPLPSRFDARILQLRSEGKRVGDVRYTAQEVADPLNCLRCAKLMHIPVRNPNFTDSWGSCPHCGQVYVFHLVPTLTA